MGDNGDAENFFVFISTIPSSPQRVAVATSPYLLLRLPSLCLSVSVVFLILNPNPNPALCLPTANNSKPSNRKRLRSLFRCARIQNRLTTSTARPSRGRRTSRRWSGPSIGATRTFAASTPRKFIRAAALEQLNFYRRDTEAQRRRCGDKGDNGDAEDILVFISTIASIPLSPSLAADSAPRRLCG